MVVRCGWVDRPLACIRRGGAPPTERCSVVGWIALYRSTDWRPWWMWKATSTLRTWVVARLWPAFAAGARLPRSGAVSKGGSRFIDPPNGGHGGCGKRHPSYGPGLWQAFGLHSPRGAP